jgi:hypothetical protein
MTNLEPTSYLWWESETTSSKVRKKTRMPNLPIPIQHSTVIPSKSNKARRNERNKISQVLVKVYFFAEDMILYLKDPKILPPQNFWTT